MSYQQKVTHISAWNFIQKNYQINKEISVLFLVTSWTIVGSKYIIQLEEGST